MRDERLYPHRSGCSFDLLTDSGPLLNRSHDGMYTGKGIRSKCVRVGNVTPRDFQADLGHRKSKCAVNVYHREGAYLCVCVGGPSVLTRLLESDKKSDWTRLEYEFRAGERESGRAAKWEERGRIHC